MEKTYPEADHDTEGDGKLLDCDEGSTNFRRGLRQARLA